MYHNQLKTSFIIYTKLRAVAMDAPYILNAQMAFI